MVFTIKTSFDLSENRVFAALDVAGKPFGVLKVSDSKMKFIYNDGKIESFGDDVTSFEDFVRKNDLHFNSPSAVDSKWVEYQPNPQKYVTGDCTIRAYTKTENMSWEDAYDMASNAGMEVAALPDDPKVVEKMLTEKLGYTKYKYTKDERCTLNEFAIAHPFGTYICKMRRHVVAVVDGFYYDSWDSGEKKVTEYYEK